MTKAAESVVRVEGMSHQPAQQESEVWNGRDTARAGKESGEWRRTRRIAAESVKMFKKEIEVYRTAS